MNDQQNNPNSISSVEFQRLITKGVITVGKGNRIKLNKLLPEYIEMLKKDNVRTNLFSGKEQFDASANKMFTTITLRLPGEPMPKQSVRFTASRYFQDGIHQCPWCGDNIAHRKGDVVTYRNKNTGLVDCIVKAYSESEHDKRTADYKNLINLQLPDGFTPFKEEVHILKMDFIFSCLKSFSAKKIKQIEDGVIIYKVTKPDYDNTCKLLLDSMNNIIYNDDALICNVNNIRKIYGIQPMVYLEIKGI